jgi:NAD/NADP transhydrogenase beta subunit
MRPRPSASAQVGQIHGQALVEMGLGVAIGAITFTGSIIAFLKLDGRMSGKPIILPQRHCHQHRPRRRALRDADDLPEDGEPCRCSG